MKIGSNEVTHSLLGVRFLQNLNLNTIEDIAKQIQVENFSKDELLVEHGQVGKRLYIIFKGKVEIQTPDQNGKIYSKITLKENSVVGEISLLINSTYSSDIVALTDTIALYLDRERFMRLIEKHNEFAEIISDLMTRRMGHIGGINKVGKYELTGVLGEGNMATVYSAYDKELEREVAIKMLKYKLAYNADFLNRFEQEAKIIASLNHPNIINVIDIIDEYSTRFIVMEKLEGESLFTLLQTNGAFEVTQTREILSQLASALQYAHNHGENGIVHRDIKPSNIVVDGYGNVKLTDYGIAGPPQDKNIFIEGTPAYLAPEIINGEPVDGRADIYALGVLAFRMLTNRLPFEASTLAELLKNQLHQIPPNIKEICPEIDSDFDNLIKDTMIKDVTRRISDWDQIRKILKVEVRQEPISLGGDETSITIRLQNTSQQQSTKIITGIRKMLKNEDVKFSIETQKADLKSRNQE
jgi:serine/threonine protein kinase